MRFEVSRRTSLSAPDAWDRLTDWPRHTSFIPFTAVVRRPGPWTGVGSRFTAWTSIGPVGFEDPMEVTFWRPPTQTSPGRCQIDKRGSTLVGWAALTVTPEPDGECTVTWLEDATFRRLGPVFSWPNAVVGKVVFGRLVDGLLR